VLSGLAGLIGLLKRAWRVQPTELQLQRKYDGAATRKSRPREREVDL
jgi:hypothetical protein